MSRRAASHHVLVGAFLKISWDNEIHSSSSLYISRIDEASMALLLNKSLEATGVKSSAKCSSAFT